MFARKYLESLTTFPHRGTATMEEARAAAWIADALQSLGYQVETQRFRTPRDTLYLGPSVVMTGFAAAAVVAARWPWAALVLCLLLLLPLIGELLGSSRLDLDLLLPTYPSQNVVARPKAGAKVRRRVIVSAHYDTQRASALFHPAVARHLQRYFATVYALIGLMMVMLFLRGVLPASAWAQPVLYLLAGLLLVNVAFLMYCRLSGGYINGANDNGSGTALALALAEHFAGRVADETEIWFLFTGAEEVGTRGMKHFVATADLDPVTTSFINIDNVGGGKLHYLLGEGMLTVRPYGKQLLALADELATAYPERVAARGNLLLPTDGLIPALAGFEAISFLAFLPDGALPHYHWYTDTLENIDFELLEFAERFLLTYVSRVAKVHGARETA